MTDAKTNLDTLFTPGLIAEQQPQWPGGPLGAPVAKAVAQLKKLPPLVFAGECDNLKAKIAEAQAGRAFWLQGGDCAETFASAQPIQFETESRRSCKWLPYFNTPHRYP